MPREPVEFTEADKSLRLNVFIAVALYVMVAVLLEPVIDFVLTQGKTHIVDPQAMQALARRKEVLMSISFTLLRALPMLFFLWYGFRIIASAKLPPGGMRFPYRVRRITGKQATMFGWLLMLVAVLLLGREMSQLARTMVG